MQFSAHTCQMFRDEINKALQVIGDTYGVQIQANKAAYTDDNISFKLDISNVTADGEVLTREVTNLKAYAGIWGLTDQQISMPFNVGGHMYTLIGYKPTARVRPMIVKREDGKRFVMDTQSVLRHIKQ